MCFSPSLLMGKRYMENRELDMIDKLPRSTNSMTFRVVETFLSTH